MSNNTSSSPSTNFSVLCSLDDGNIVYDVYVCEVFFACSIIIASLSPVAVAGNALILAAIWKKTFQRTPFHLLLSGLAFTDLLTGLIAQPLIAAPSLLAFVNPTAVIARPVLVTTISTIGNASNIYFFMITLLIMTVMSIERWLHMSRRSLVTSRHGYFICTVLLLTPIPLVILRALSDTNRTHGREASVMGTLILFVCLLTISMAYFKVFRIIRQHQHQVQANQSSQNFDQPAINLAKYKKSIFSILYIIALFLFCFLPMTVFLAVHVYVGDTFAMEAAFNVCLVLLFLSSSLNPCLYLWRMHDVRNGVKQLFR